MTLRTTRHTRDRWAQRAPPRTWNIQREVDP